MERLRRAATVPNAVAASSIGQLIHLHVKIQMRKKWPMVDQEEVSLCRRTRRAAWKKIPVSRNGPDTPKSSKKQRRAVSSSSIKTKVDIFLPHDVREVVLIPFFLQFSGFREDDILLEGVGEDNTMAFEEASRRRAVGKSRRAVGAKSSEIITAGRVRITCL